MARRKRATAEELERARPDPARPDRDTLIRRMTAPREPRLTSPVARAVVPVLGGIAVIVAIGLFTWGIAAWLSSGEGSPSERLAPQRLELGSVQGRANDVADEGPILITELSTVDGDRSIVVDHEGGDDATVGWRIYYAYPDGRPDCPVTQVIGTATFLDCDGAELDVSELAPPIEPIRPVVENERTLYLDLRAFNTSPQPDDPGDG
ncbi:MAG: hypothetical protein AAGG08_01850 [Actinomycetota bacterium]